MAGNAVSISCSVLMGWDRPLVSPERGLEMIAQAGFRRVELSRHHPDVGSYAGLLRELGIEVWAVHGTLGDEAVSRQKAVREKMITKEMDRLENAAVYAPCPYVVHYLYRHNDPAIGALWADAADRVLEKAASLGFNLAVETVPFKPEKNERYADSLEVAEFVRSRGSKRVSICVDINHSNLNEDLVGAIGNCKGLISTIHVSDNHGRREEHLYPGQGTTDFAAALGALRESGYTGPLNIEVRGQEPMAVESLRALREWAEKLLEETE